MIEQSLTNQRNQYRILTIHGSRMKNLDEIPVEIQRDCPFPILLDATGRMEHEYGVECLPFYVVIDTQGIVIPITQLHEFVDLVKGTYKKYQLGSKDLKMR